MCTNNIYYDLRTLGAAKWDYDIFIVNTELYTHVIIMAFNEYVSFYPVFCSAVHALFHVIRKPALVGISISGDHPHLSMAAATAA